MSVGQRNADFVLQFLKAEQIRVTARDLVDIYPRKVHYFPTSGRVLVKKLTGMNNSTILKREIDYRTKLDHDQGGDQAGGDIELFT